MSVDLINRFQNLGFREQSPSNANANAYLEASTVEEYQAIQQKQGFYGINFTDESGFTPLINAIRTGRDDLVRWLVEDGGVNPQDVPGEEMFGRHGESLGFKPDKDFGKGIYYMEPLAQCVLVQNEGAYAFLVENGFEPVTETLLIVLDQITDLMNPMLSRLVGEVELNDSGFRGETPLTIALSREPEITPFLVRGLLEKGADPNFYADRRLTPLSLAIAHANRESIVLLFQYGAVFREEELHELENMDPSLRTRDFLIFFDEVASNYARERNDRETWENLQYVHGLE